VRIVPDPDLEDLSVLFRLNHVPSLPAMCPAPGELVVQQKPRVFALMNINARGVADPLDTLSLAIVDAAHERLLTAVGAVVMERWVYAARLLSALLIRHQSRLVNSRVVDALLQRSESAYPALVRMVRSRWSLTSLARLLRSLLDEGVPIDDFRQILERILEYPLWQHENSRLAVIEDRVQLWPAPAQENADESLLRCIRQSLRQRIAGAFSNGEGLLEAYLVDDDLDLRDKTCGIGFWWRSRLNFRSFHSREESRRSSARAAFVGPLVRRSPKDFPTSRSSRSMSFHQNRRCTF
jgi:type III secretory pathway component EscV